LIGVRSCDNNDGSIARNLPRTARVDFAEEEVDKDGEGPQPSIIDEVWPEAGLGLARRGHVS